MRAKAVVWGLATVAAAAGVTFCAHRYAVPRVSRHTPAASAAEGAVVLGPATQELGEQLWGTVVPFELALVNEGRVAVTIASVTASCHCISTDLLAAEGTTVAPGSSCPLLGLLETRNVPGQQDEWVRIRLADGREQTASLSARVYGTYTVTPEVLDFGGVWIGYFGPPEDSAEIVFASDSEQVLSEPQVDVPWVRCELAENGDGRTVFRVTLLSAQLVPGLQTGMMRLRSSARVRPESTVRLRVIGVEIDSGVSRPSDAQSGAYVVEDQSRKE